MLRIDVDTPDTYKIPDGNPFKGNQAGKKEEIWAFGLRNPWRCGFDRKTGDLFIGDVGQDAVEEIDVVSDAEASGANFGWSAFEGDDRFNDDQSPEGAIPPVLTAAHDDGYCSITGGVVVRDPRIPALDGRYVYGDLCKPELRSFTPRAERKASDDKPVGIDVEQLASFGTDNAGRVYAVSIAGPVYRLDPGR
jgi:glucose/arabinose dehydrogenase